jgi:hypothetical protein
VTARLGRRLFLGGLGAAAGTALFGSHLGRLARAEGTAPKRLLIIHKPCGTVPSQYDPTGGERDFTLSPILAPFAPLRDRMVVLEGLDIRKMRETPGQDHGNGMVTFMTGGVTITADGFRAVIAERESIDHILSNVPEFVGDTPIPYVQLAADTRSDRDEVFTRVLTYSGRAAPVPPEQRPSAAFSRIFGSLADGGGTATREALERARLRKQSVLDFSRNSLARLSARAGAAERERLDAHLEAVRELERRLDGADAALPAACTDPEALSAMLEAVDPSEVNAQHAPIGLAHLDIVRTAFQCDLTRIATFQWAAGNSHVNFSGLIDGVENAGHHNITHSGDNREHDEAEIHRWYNEHMASFLTAMRDTPDVDGSSLLDNTLVVVWSEIRLGRHTFDNVPIQLFGGPGVGLEGGRKLGYDGRSTNDLWVAIANALGHPMTTFGDEERCEGLLPGVF